ncbi:tRNA (adenosine(37)-N6)-dimethylallyltransferase MiaA [Vallitalea okinawensis]|uniref:tRNA (adenosine(37)-N6)-dimethylallyltransferase MiaA n=1 Tax=Vallitalea okinawensis TaxID=2078660 RepID=UPI000CFD63A0|nr:tRNA (adenosine(37)-N6)-dimethylallyltransferase MiaA [Vallitalea okinawensis]
MKKKPMIIIAGPTAVGKTSTSIQLAKRIGGEIISADSMQVYKAMDIGTAKIKEEEMDGVPHYLLDELNPDDPFSVADFQRLAKQYYDDIISRGKIPIIVGGTGFYLQSIIYDIDFNEMEPDHEYRNELTILAGKEGTKVVHKLLREVDEVSANAIPHQNLKRVIRALEYYKQAGEPISLHNNREREKETPYDLAFFVLNMNREKLYERINMRVDMMLDEGLLDEVRSLLDQGYDWDLVSMKGLGYKEFKGYFDGTQSLEEAIDILKRDTRHFAKRQLTWFRRESNVTWIDVEQLGLNATKVTDFMMHYIENNLHIL